MDYYVPPKEIAPVPAIYCSIEKDDSNLSFIQKMLNSKPTNDELKNFAIDISHVFSDGFQWNEIAKIMNISIKYLNNFLFMSVEEKRENVISILDYLIDISDTPYLPDSFFDPLFKSMVPCFVKLLIPDSIEDYFPQIKTSEKPSDETFTNFAQDLIKDCKNGLTWEDLVKITQNSIQFMNQFINMSKEEKIKNTEKIIDYVIDQTDTPFLPDYYSDKIFKSLANGFITQIFSSVPTL